MIYLDYSASTPVNREVLDSFNKVNLDFIGNANSSHKLGSEANNLIISATNQIKDILNINDKEIIYTSGSSEANNLAIKGVAFSYQNRGKHIITSHFEHSSVIETLNYLSTLGFEIDYVDYNEDGTINLNHLKKLIRDDTILVTINHVNSEIGIIEPINEIGSILKDYSRCFFHVDLTQSIGKLDINFDLIDLASFSAHKIYGLKGIGCLIKNKNIELTSLIHGGVSTTKYRSGTPAHPLIVSVSKALRLINEKKLENYEYVMNLNKYLKEKLVNYENVYINSNSICIPHILNISIKGVQAETFMRALSDRDVFVSTKSACHDKFSLSESVLNLTHDESLAISSIRISLSHITTIDELNKFLEIFDECYKKLIN